MTGGSRIGSWRWGTLLALAGLLWAARLLAAAADPNAALLACRAVVDSEARLACFDRESAQLAASASAPAPAATHSLTREERFGLQPTAVAAREGRPVAPPDTALQAHVSALADRGDGAIVFTLDNGQAWRQTTAIGDDLLLKVGDPVRVTKGALGVYWLRAASGRSCKVTRER